MNYNKNYYGILGVTHNSSDTEIKKSYRKLSFQHHPDKNGDQVIFGEITEAYDILMDLDKKSDYDKKSKYGKNYDELEALFIVNIDFNYENENSKYEDFKKNVVLNVVQKVDDTFNGTLEYKRWVICKTCKGTGKDTTSKFVIKDENGNVKGIFDSDDGCDFCEGTGKDFRGKISKLINLLDTDQTKCKVAALKVLRIITTNVRIRKSIGELDGIKTLVDLLKDPDEEIKALAAETLAHCSKNGKINPFLQDILIN